MIPSAPRGCPRVARLVALALAAIFLLLWAGVGTRDLPGDLILYFDYANFVDDGHVPYRDFQLEYPPLALVPILLPFFGSGGGSFAAFEAVFALEMGALAIAGGWLVWLLMQRVLPEISARERGWRMAAYVIAWPLLGQIVTTRFDPLPTVLTVAALVLWLERRERAAWVMLALGVATKLFPLIIAPLFAIDLLARRGWRASVSGGAFFGAACVVGFLPGLLLSPDGLRRAFTYHSERGMQLESLYANGLLLLGKTTSFSVSTVHAFGSFEAFSGWTDELKPISALVQMTALGVVYFGFHWLRTRPAAGAAAGWERQIIVGSALALVVFIVAGKVFSPQYLIWLMPFIPLIPGRAGRNAIGVFLLALLFTQLLFPYAYDALIDREVIGIALLTARNALAVALLALLVEALLVEKQARRS